jgi:hypothetical protein
MNVYASTKEPYKSTVSKLSPSHEVPVTFVTAATGTENPVPVPPMLAAVAESVLPTLYRHPPLRITTDVTAPPLTVISARAAC